MLLNSENGFENYIKLRQKTQKADLNILIVGLAAFFRQMEKT